MTKLSYEGTIDVRITYTHSGTKVNISYWGCSSKQKKPFKTYTEAMLDALHSYRENCRYYMVLDNHKYSVGGEREKEFRTEAHKREALEDVAMSTKLLPFIEESIELVNAA